MGANCSSRKSIIATTSLPQPQQSSRATARTGDVSINLQETLSLYASLSDDCPAAGKRSMGGSKPPDIVGNMDAIVAKARTTMSRCPLGHGGVGAGPFPGYVHGNHPEVCRMGCKPDPALGKHGRIDETPHETLVREALEYAELYHREKNLTDEVKEVRIKQILSEIESTGTYKQTIDELQHGARVAWRNAPKCSNRKFWEELNLIDFRRVVTAEDMFLGCLELLEAATLSCVTTANIAVFRPQTPGTQDGPRVWNSQLIRFAGYRRKDNTVFGEKAEADFTAMLQEDLGWAPPPEEKRTRFDVLPLVLQAHPDQQPKLFTLPPQYVARVHITHPDHPQIAELGLQWYAVPAVSSMELSVGGITYTAAPFTGWYSVTEIVRNLTDESRYDQCAQVGAKLGLDTRADHSMWIDMAMVTVTQAVMHSFRTAGFGMVDHHTLMKNFWGWYNKEKAQRGYIPGNWKWIVPPISASASPCYLQLNKMTEYTLKPNYWYSPGWRAYRTALKSGSTDVVKKVDIVARRTRQTHAASVALSEHRLFIAYASVTGTTAKYAEAVASVLSCAIPVMLYNMEEFDADVWTQALNRSSMVVLMTSTYGPGAPPSTAKKFLAWLQRGLSAEGEAHALLCDKLFTVLGFGSTSYPRFCAAADTMFSLVSATGAVSAMPVTKVDALSHEELTVWNWASNLIKLLNDYGLLTTTRKERALSRVPLSSDGKPKPFVPMYTFVDLAGVEGLRPANDRFRREATVVEVKELIKSSAGEAGTSVKEPRAATKQIILDVSNLTGLSYLAGDELAVWPENPPEAVEAAALGLGLTQQQQDGYFLLQRIPIIVANSGEMTSDGEDDVSGLASAPFPLPNTMRTILTKYVALLDAPSYDSVQALALFAPTDERLKAISKSYNAYQEWVLSTGARWCDVWRHFPQLAGLAPAVFFQLVPLIKPRHYSISSSSALRPGQLHLTVAGLSYKLPTGELRYGLCSQYLGTRQPGNPVAIKVLPTPGFRLPLDPSAPVIMVAAGAGLAPFKSFWEERLARQAAMRSEADASGHHPLAVLQMGPCLLIFGCRYSNVDYLYNETIQEAVSEGALSQVLTAFSREARGPGGQKYVQDVVLARAEELKTMLAHKACHVYVCGSSNMAQEVAVAFKKVMGVNDFAALVQHGRYHEDVFGIELPDHRAAVRSAAARGAVTLLGSASPEEVAELLDGGSLSLDSVDHSYSTLLHVAVRAANIPLAQLLLERGCALNVLDMYGCTPLQIAKMSDNKDLESLLESNGARLTSRLVSQYYPVHAAVMEGDTEALRKALAAGANLAATEYHGLTPLHVACAVSGPETIKMLLDAGAPLDVVTRRGLLALQLALVLQRKEAVALLQAADAPFVVKQMVTATECGDCDVGNAEWDTDNNAQMETVVSMTQWEMAALQGSWVYVSGSAFPQQSRKKLEAFGVDFFLCLFDQCPQLLSLFPFRDDEGKPIVEKLKVHAMKVFSALGDLVQLFPNVAVLARTVEALVDRHIPYGVEKAHYNVLFKLLAQMLMQNLGSMWEGPTASAWKKLADMVCTIADKVYTRRRALLAEQGSSDTTSTIK